MELTSEHFTLAKELMEYLPKGDGLYQIQPENTDCHLISATVIVARDDKKDVLMEQRPGEPAQFFADIHFVLNDESRGSMQVCFAPSTVILMDCYTMKIEKGESIQDKLVQIPETTMNTENTTLWAKSLMNYISKGNGIHNPNALDSMLGMKKVAVTWAYDNDKHALYHVEDSPDLLFRCQVAYGTEDKVSGSVVYSVMPYEINFV